MTNGTQEEEIKSPWMIRGKTYDSLKFGVMVLLPGLSTLYFALGTIWGLPAVEQVIATSAAFATFFGLLLRHSSKVYDASDERFDGAIKYKESADGSKMFTLEVPGDPNEISNKDVIVFKVAHD